MLNMRLCVVRAMFVCRCAAAAGNRLCTTRLRLLSPRLCHQAAPMRDGPALQQVAEARVAVLLRCWQASAGSRPLRSVT